LRAYAWPGNVRELRNVVVRAAVFATSDEIGVDVLSQNLMADPVTDGLRQLALLPELEKNAILKTLEDAQGHQATAAARLGISRRTLQRKLKTYRMAV